MSRPENVKWKPNTVCKKNHRLWTAPDSMASEHEVSDFVLAMIRLTKPSLVVETGTYHAHTSIAIGKALKRNTVGRLVTFEVDPDNAQQARKNVSEANLQGIITIHDDKLDRKYLDAQPVEFAWLDSCMRCRQDEMDTIWPVVAPGGVVMVHDASDQRPPGDVRPPNGYEMFRFGTPRGLNAFQKAW